MGTMTSAILGKGMGRGAALVWGTFTNASSTGGDVITGLSRVFMFYIQPTGDAVNSNEASVNETFPLNGGDVTVKTDSDSETYGWLAIGVK
jgi:hypothetical protein